MGRDAVDLFEVIAREDSAAPTGPGPATSPVSDGEVGGTSEGQAAAESSAEPEAEDVDIVLRVHVQPGAGRTEVVGRHGDALKVRVAAPPEGGRANQAVGQLLATTLGVAPSNVTLVSGSTSRSKRFRIGPVQLDVARRLLTSAESGGTGGGSGRSGNARGGGGVR